MPSLNLLDPIHHNSYVTFNVLSSCAWLKHLEAAENHHGDLPQRAGHVTGFCTTSIPTWDHNIPLALSAPCTPPPYYVPQRHARKLKTTKKSNKGNFPLFGGKCSLVVHRISHLANTTCMSKIRIILLKVLRHTGEPTFPPFSQFCTCRASLVVPYPNTTLFFCV